MANDFEVKVGVSVDESALKGLEDRLLALRDKSGKIKVDVDTENGRQKINSFYNEVNSRFKNVKLTPSLDTSKIKKDISEVQRTVNQFNRVSSKGIDPNMLLTGSEKSLRQVSETLRRMPDQALDALNQAGFGSGRALTEYIENTFNIKGVVDSFDKSTVDLVNSIKKLDSTSETYFDDISNKVNEWKGHISESFSSAAKSIQGFSGKITNVNQDENGNWRLVQNAESGTIKQIGKATFDKEKEIDEATASIIEFNNAGQQTVNTFRNMEQSFKVLEGGADVFKKALNDTQQASILDFLKRELENVGVAFDEAEGDISQYINKMKVGFDEVGRMISANITANIKGNTITAAFKSNTVGDDVDALELSGANIITSQEKALQDLRKKYNEIIALKKELYREPENADIINRQITQREEEANAIKEQISNQEKLNQVTDEYTDKVNKLERTQQKKTQDQQDASYLKDVIQSLKTLEQLQNKINSLQNSGKLNTNQIEGYKQEIQQITEELKSLGVTYDSVKNKFSFSSTDLSGLVNSADSLEKLNNLLNQFKNTINNINAKQMDFIDNQKVQEAIQLLEQLQKKKLELEKAQLSGASSSYIDALIQDINRLEQELQQATQEQLSFNQTVGQSNTYQSAFANSVNESAMAMEKLQSSAQQAQSSTSNLNNGFDGVIARCASMAASFAIFDQLQNALYSSVDAVKELDSAMTSLQMVTEQSDESIQNMMNGYADMANELGVTLKTVAEGSEEWLRQGFSTDQTEELLKASTMLSTIGDMGADEASEALTAVLNGFNMQSSAAMEVVDTLNALDSKRVQLKSL